MKMDTSPSLSSPPQLNVTSPKEEPVRPGMNRRTSSTLHKHMMTKLRPLPFQYIWTLWHDNASSHSLSYSERLQVLAESVPDIAAFYRIYNNFPWNDIKLKNSVHVFRQGVKPLWEDEQNLEGGAWVIKSRREDDRAIKLWEEICLMGCGGELQAALSPREYPTLQ